jgi:transposase
MYQRKSRLSIYKQGELIKMFVAEATARASAEIVGVNKQTAATFFTRLRLLIASKLPSYELSG